MMSTGRDRYITGLWLLTITGLLLRLYMAHIDPFLHIWDERFHALVASNMMDQPLKPMLRSNPVFPADYTNWTQAHIWVHKQPLFLWQMALSMKIFGATVYALRYPSVLMGTLMIPMVYSVALSLSHNKRISLLTAGLFCFSNFHLELVGGMRGMDHNDLCLEFYVLASIWSWIRYEKTGKWYWALLTGVFAGGAVLTKWLIGLFVFQLWGLKLLLSLKQPGLGKRVLFFLAAFLLCCLVFVPWQWYIMKHFPVEAAFEYAFNRRHLTEALEGHSGSVFFYLGRFPQMFGEGIFLLIFPGIWLYARAKDRDRALTLPVVAGVLFVMAFFSFAVQSKSVTYVFFIAPVLLLFQAYSLDFMIGKIKRAYLVVFLLVGVGVLSCKPEKIILSQATSNEARNKEIRHAAIYKSLKQHLPDSVKVVTNVPDCISLMFFNKGIMAYELFTEEQVQLLEARKVPIGIYTKGYCDSLPAYLRHYPYVFILPGSLD